MGLSPSDCFLENLAQSWLRGKFADFGFVVASGRERENKVCSK